METGLKDKSIIVTGGASNIGRGIVLAFAREGGKIAIVDIDEKQSHKVALTASNLGAAGTLVVLTDVTHEGEVGDMVKRVLSEFGTIDVLVNNVGFPYTGSFLEQPREMRDRDIDLNLHCTINCLKAVLPHMIKRKSGRVVNIGSDSARMGDPDHSVYAACKAAVMSLTKSIAWEVGPYEITVNCVSPGGDRAR